MGYCRRLVEQSSFRHFFLQERPDKRCEAVRYSVKMNDANTADHAKSRFFGVLKAMARNLREVSTGGSLSQDKVHMRHKLIPLFALTVFLAAFFVVTPAVFAQKMTTAEVEQRLSDLGYWITKVDGKSDDSTRQAIIAFQKV